MAFTLTCSVVERNDNKLLTISDTTGGCSATSWGVGGNPTVSSITAIGGGHPLTLDIKITTSDGTETTYDIIDLHQTFLTSGHSTYDDLVFPLTCAMLIQNGTAIGTSSTEFPDGIYEITYSYGEPDAEEAYVTDSVLIDGIVTSDIYALLRTITTKYECGGPHEKDTLDIIFMRTYLSAMHVSTYVARTDSILKDLTILERLIDDVSTYTW
jgi:hypothetical protein